MEKQDEQMTEGTHSQHSTDEIAVPIPPPTDRWGFVSSSIPPVVQAGPPQAEERRRLLKENRRLLKWVSMRGSDDFASLSPERRGALGASRRAQLERRVHKGIPDAIRGVVWQTLSGARTWTVPDYHELRAQAMAEPPPDELDPAIVDQIELDLNRTFPSHFLWLPTKPRAVLGATLRAIGTGRGAGGGSTGVGGGSAGAGGGEAAAPVAEAGAGSAAPAVVGGASAPVINSGVRTVEEAGAGEVEGGSLAAEVSMDEPFEMVELEEPADDYAKTSLARQMMASLADGDDDDESEGLEAGPSRSHSRAASEVSGASSSLVSSFSSGMVEGMLSELGSGAGGATPPGVDLLRTLLRMYALHDSEVLYCQSMNFVAGTLLMYMTPEVAFRTFAHLLGPLGFRRMYLPGLPLLMGCLDELQLQMDKQLPKLAAHLRRHGVHPSLFATQWFMTFGLDQFPFAMGVRLLDLVFYEGSLSPLFRLALALLRRRHRQLVAIRDPSELMRALRQLPAAIDDVDGFFTKDVPAQKLKLSRELLRAPSAGEAG
jgi:hypothetical protein